jgi:LuxR family transcriptional regulator, maltose regulon positive regulatory protein
MRPPSCSIESGPPRGRISARLAWRSIAAGWSMRRSWGRGPCAPLARSAGSSEALSLLVSASLARGDLDRAEQASDELDELAELVGTPALRAQAGVAAGRVAIARGEHDRARTLLEDSVDRYQQTTAPFEEVVARIELAVALRGLGREEDAGRELRAALGASTELGAGPAGERARRLLESLDVGEGVQSSAGTGGPVDAESLTPREHEVLALLAEGLTNRQIAKRLIVSEHTVHRHVTNILRKLALPSRTAAAAYALREGLLE